MHYSFYFKAIWNIYNTPTFNWALHSPIYSQTSGGCTLFTIVSTISAVYPFILSTHSILRSPCTRSHTCFNACMISSYVLSSVNFCWLFVVFLDCHTKILFELFRRRWLLITFCKVKYSSCTQAVVLSSFYICWLCWGLPHFCLNYCCHFNHCKVKLHTLSK